MSAYNWASPWFFSFFILLALIALSYIWTRKYKKAYLQISSLSLIKKVTPSFKKRILFAPYLLYILGLAFIIVALARPQFSNERVKKTSEGIDIVLTLDISDSMMIEDMDPESRINSAKKVLIEFVQDRPNDRIGLVAFKGEAFSRVPMTLDHDILVKNIKALDPNNRNIRDGTAIGSALALSVARLKDSTAKSRVIILATDGENNMGTIDPETALEIAKGYNLRIYTIGIGKDGDSKLPIIGIDPFGRPVKTYQSIHSAVNDALLTKMAKDTGGEYYKADSGSKLRKVFQSIDKLEKSKIDSQRFVKYEEKYQEFLILAGILIGVGYFLSLVTLRVSP